jgi:hypothetical protein
MARRTAALTFEALGQTLETLVRNGRPTSATFEVFRQYDDDEADAAFSGSATVDSPNTTLSGAAGPTQADPYRLPLTSTAGLVAGKRYLLSQNSLQEWLTLSEVGSGYARALEPLQNAYTSGATFQSTWLSAAVDATFIQDLDNLSDLLDTTPDYRVKWTIVVGGATVVAYTFFDVVRAVMSHAVEISDLDDAAPGLLHTLPVHHRADAGRRLISRAWSSVRAELLVSGVDINAIREEEVLDELVILRGLLALAEGGWSPPGMDKADYLRDRTDKWDRFLEKHFKVVLKHPVEAQDTSTPRAMSLFVK